MCILNLIICSDKSIFVGYSQVHLSLKNFHGNSAPNKSPTEKRHFLSLLDEIYYKRLELSYRIEPPNWLQLTYRTMYIYTTISDQSTDKDTAHDLILHDMHLSLPLNWLQSCRDIFSPRIYLISFLHQFRLNLKDLVILDMENRLLKLFFLIMHINFKTYMRTLKHRIWREKKSDKTKVF